MQVAQGCAGAGAERLLQGVIAALPGPQLRSRAALLHLHQKVVAELYYTYNKAMDPMRLSNNEINPLK